MFLKKKVEKRNKEQKNKLFVKYDTMIHINFFK